MATIRLNGRRLPTEARWASFGWAVQNARRVTKDTYEFEVSGRYDFPLDMLRYDTCWPAREAEDVPAIAATFEVRRRAVA